MHPKVKIVILIILAVALMSPAVFANKKSPTTQTVAFVNSRPGETVLGLVKFVVDKNNEPIDYKILNERWTEEIRIMWLEPGLYGITQYHPKSGVITNYKNFWVKDTKVLVEL